MPKLGRWFNTRLHERLGAGDRDSPLVDFLPQVRQLQSSTGLQIQAGQKVGRSELLSRHVDNHVAINSTQKQH
jgi:hypothetical protein